MSKDIVACLGAGRSGTSVAMALLEGLGMRTSEEMIDSSDANPRGAYEDTFVFNTQHAIFQKLGLNQYFYVSANRVESADLTVYTEDLSSYIAGQVGLDNRLWGFKDPKTGSILPLWRRIFDKASVIPKYVICVRSPEDVSASYHARYQEDYADLYWLTKYVSIFRNIGTSGFILHYEDLFSPKAVEVVTELAKFVGFNDLSDADIEKVVEDTIRSQLNRAKWTASQPVNAYSASLYNVLRKCSGTGYEDEELRKCVVEIGEEIDKFEGMTEAAVKIIKRKEDRVNKIEQGMARAQKNVEKKLKQEFEEKILASSGAHENAVSKIGKDYDEQISHLLSANKDYRVDLEKLTGINEGFSKKLVTAQDAIDDYEHKVASLIRNNKKTGAKKQRSVMVTTDQARYITLRLSYTYRFVSIFADAPLSVKNFLLVLPRLLNLVADIFTRKGRLKQKVAVLTAKPNATIDWKNKLEVLKKSRRYVVSRKLVSLFRLGRN